MLFELFNNNIELNSILTRSFWAFIFSFVVFMVSGDKMIDIFRRWQKGGQPIREDGPQSHVLTKQGTPTMGGLIILAIFFLSVFLFCDLKNQYIWVICAVTFGYSVLGFFDDYFKVKKRNTKGVAAKGKLIVQFLIAVGAIFWINSIANNDDFFKVAIPLFDDFSINLSYLYVIFGLIVIVGSSNGVNLTDGLDGLASIPIIAAAKALSIIALFSGTLYLSKFFSLPSIAGTAEIFVLTSALCGSVLGFLWFNANPAKIFMGDVGSLSMGGTLGTIAIIIKQELVFAIIAGLFVVESLSSMLQIAYYRKTGGKRLFLMAPIHHHYEKKGWSEVNVVKRFWIVSIMLAILGVAIAI